ncbi:unnamed protein product [Phyllotreta striolata]|uniref:Multidrug resistance-associated protein 4-like n=1 Tax=Phyllotreta striolata TaxID=444603 RepID=A0A9N9U0B9_PHYSR|nr:unnamed protein product [Phyllotreta striolata]
MDSSSKHNKRSPQENANFISKLFFFWMLPFFKFGYKNNLKPTDIYDILQPDKADSHVPILKGLWDKELEARKEQIPSLKKVIFKTYAKAYSLSGIIICFQVVVVKSLQPVVLAEYIRFFDKTQKYDTFGEYSGWILASATVLLAFLFALTYHHAQLDSQRVGMRVRVGLSSLVYRKVLKLSQASLSKTPPGKLVNMLSNDLQRIDICSQYLHYVWVMPLQAAVCFYILYQNIGIAALAGTVALMIEGIPMQGYLSRLQGRLRSKIAEKTDLRVKLMNEIVSGIKVIKMYAWENYFAKVVEQSRCEEVKKIRQTQMIKGFTLALIVITERFGLYCSVICYVLLGNVLTAEKVFACAQLFNSLQLYMCACYPLAMAGYAEAVVSVKRIEKFLLLEENRPNFDSIDEPVDKTGEIFVEKASGKWCGSVGDTLSDVSFQLGPGKLCCVVGTVGSGKTSLLQLLLKELPLSCGTLEVNGTVSYASQEPWLFLSSVRDNILFGRPYIKSKYKEVVHVCALETDFRQFPFDDKTTVEERGVSLSGGQRARINLARAVYAEADIYLLDDPLSAVDTRVGKHLFEKCIKGYLKEKTTILVTHQLQFLEEADLIIILEDGKIKKMGTYNELSKDYLSSLQPDEEEETQQKQKVVDKHLEKRESLAVSEIGPEENLEEIASGSIPYSVYIQYFAYGTTLIGFIIMVFLFILAQLSCNAGDLWLTYWVNHESEIFNKDDVDNVQLLGNNTFNQTLHTYSTLKDEEETDLQNLYMIIYSSFMAAGLILTPIRSLNFTRIVMNSCKNLHHKMFGNVLEAPMKFFDTNPSGRVLNRFSNDMGIIDEILPKAYMDFIQIFLVLIGILMIVFIKVPAMIAPALVLTVAFYYLRLMYLKTSQNVKRLEGVNRAPIFSHLIATMDGMTTIRASRAEEMITKEFDALLDQHSGTWYLYIACNEIFGWILDFLSVVFIAFVAYQFLIFEPSEGITGTVGLTLSQCLILTGMLQMGVRQTAEVTNNMVSVERVLQYTNIKKETDDEVEDQIVSKDLVETYKPINTYWPEHGEIKFKNVYLFYDPTSQPVLKNLNLVIKPGQKVGVVGRTGAGKSSLIAALFRLTEIEGSIIIDDVDTKSLKLKELRSKISIIPQEPVLFSATVRYNLDPFSSVSDDVLWQALENVELKQSITSLDSEVSDSGSNFSTGQRQLLCLARAVVRNNKILVLDEATANVDPSTDVLIQKTIRKNFKTCTVITIAHRLNTIMDSDKVLVMDGGKAVEFAHPHLLLNNFQGSFSKMLRETSPAMEAALKKIAEEHYTQTFM